MSLRDPTLGDTGRDDRYVIEGATYDRLEAKCDRYREALERIRELEASLEARAIASAALSPPAIRR